MSLALLLALLAAVLAFGPLVLLWWLPEHRSRANTGRSRRSELGNGLQ
jgi:hypothetical protein